MLSDTVSDIKNTEALIDTVEILQNLPVQPSRTKKRSYGTA